MVVLPPGRYLMSLQPSDETKEANEGPQQEVVIDHSFAIAAHEVTNGDFRRFPGHAAWKKQLEEWVNSKEVRLPREQCDDPFRPAAGTSWYDAAEYCNWLSQQDGLDEEQWCYERNADRNFAEGMRLSKNFLERAGYRLPTEKEWEYACRAGTTTGRYYGQGEELLPKATAFAYAGQPTEPMFQVGSLKPNDWGIFDMLGNAPGMVPRRNLERQVGIVEFLPR